MPACTKSDTHIVLNEQIRNIGIRPNATVLHEAIRHAPRPAATTWHRHVRHWLEDSVEFESHIRRAVRRIDALCMRVVIELGPIEQTILNLDRKQAGIGSASTNTAIRPI